MDSRADKLMFRSMDIAFWPLDMAEKRLPKGLIRFFGYLIALPMAIVLGMPLAAPLMIAAVFLEIWDHANERKCGDKQ